MREKWKLRDGWRFHEGDVADDITHGYMYTYMHTKTERGRGPASVDYDDSTWQEVFVPHDYAVLHKPTPKANPVHGSLVRRQAWYRRNFRLEREDEEKRIRLWFEGICQRSHIWVNGCYMGFFDSAYTEIDLDITDLARFGDDLNTVSVYVDNTEYEGWWYEGAGIYRSVWLVKTEKISIQRDGIWVHPEKKEEGRWAVPVETTIQNDWDQDAAICVKQEILDEHGHVVASCQDACNLSARTTAPFSQNLSVADPARWSPDEPALYTLRTVILRDGAVQDEEETAFGFRTIVFDPDRGFLLNGIPTKIKGMCIHEDHGGFGAALPDDVKEYRIKRLKSMGCNGYRFSHNPHSRQTLEACDRLGMLVMDENRWFESSENGLRRLKQMVRRDRNHPCVIFWSMGNEESLQAGKRGKKIIGTMKAAVRSLDPERPVLMAMHTGLLEEGAADLVDVIGMNYNIDLVPKVHERYPDKAIVFSEANSCNDEDVLGDRACGIETWKIVKETPYVCGLFAWTGMDYRGEHDYPGLFALCGAMDQNGYPKESYSLYQSWWCDRPVAAIEPNRNPNLPKDQVRLVGNGKDLILYRNEKKIYEGTVEPYHPTELLIPDRSGIFCLETRKNGVVTAQTRCILEGKPDHCEILLENEAEEGTAPDTAILTLRVLDKQGYLLPDAALPFEITALTGARFLMVGNGDVTDGANRRLRHGTTYRGLAQIVVAPTEQEVFLEVKVQGVTHRIKKSFRYAGGRGERIAPVMERRYLTDWHMADWRPDQPELEAEALAQLKGYHAVEVGHGTQMHDLYKDSGFLTYHTMGTLPRKEQRKERLYLFFELLEGKTDILIGIKDEDGHVIRRIRSEKNYKEPGELMVEIPSDKNAVSAEIYVCLEVSMPFDGITKPVRWYFKEEGE